MENSVDRKKLGTWIHPATGERRIYVNGHGLFAKVWLTQAVDGGWEERFRAYEGCHVNPADVYFACLVAIEEAFGVDDGTTVEFDEMWECLAGNRDWARFVGLPPHVAAARRALAEGK